MWGLINLNCDICGSKGELFNVEIEGSRLIACDSCAAHGKRISKVLVSEPAQKKQQQHVQPSRHFQTEKEEAPVILVVDNYNVLIKNKRERLGLKQEELAKSINEKESLIQQIENKKIEPSIKIAEKLEKHLNLKLLETYKNPVIAKSASKEQGPVTLGDVINIKTRKRK
jgi:putative transcription factor